MVNVQEEMIVTLDSCSKIEDGMCSPRISIP